MSSFFWDQIPGGQLLGLVIIACVVLQETAKLFFRLALPFCIPVSNSEYWSSLLSSCLLVKVGPHLVGLRFTPSSVFRSYPWRCSGKLMRCQIVEPPLVRCKASSSWTLPPLHPYHYLLLALFKLLVTFWSVVLNGMLCVPQSSERKGESHAPYLGRIGEDGQIAIPPQ